MLASLFFCNNLQDFQEIFGFEIFQIIVNNLNFDEKLIPLFGAQKKVNLRKSS